MGASQGAALDVDDRDQRRDFIHFQFQLRWIFLQSHVRIFANVGVLLNGVDGAYGDLLNTNEEYTIVKIAANSYRWSKTSSPVT